MDPKRLESGRILDALRYVHHWEHKDRGDQKMTRLEAAKFAVRDLSQAEREVLSDALLLTAAEKQEVMQRPSSIFK